MIVIDNGRALYSSASNGSFISSVSSDYKSYAAVTVDGSNSVYLACWILSYIVRIEVYSNRALVRTVDPTPSLMSTPINLAVDSLAQVYVVCVGGNSVIKYAANGAHLMDFVAVNPSLNAPSGVAVDAAFNVYAADRGNGRIVVFSRDGVQQFVFTSGWHYSLLSGRRRTRPIRSHLCDRHDSTASCSVLFSGRSASDVFLQSTGRLWYTT